MEYAINVRKGYRANGPTSGAMISRTGSATSPET